MALISKGFALIVKFAYTALICGHIHQFSIFDVVFRFLIKALLAICRAEVMGLALIDALKLGVLAYIHPAYMILHFFTFLPLLLGIQYPVPFSTILTAEAQEPAVNPPLISALVYLAVTMCAHSKLWFYCNLEHVSEPI